MSTILIKTKSLVVVFFHSDIWQTIEPYICLGPTLVGWIIPLLKNEKTSAIFMYSFHQMALFLIYVTLLMFNSIISFINPLNYSSISIYVQSFLALIYILISVVTLVNYLKKKKFASVKLIELIGKLSL